MLSGARLQHAWHHARAHRFFAAARWSADQLGLCLLDPHPGRRGPDRAPVRLVWDGQGSAGCCWPTQYHHGSGPAPTMVETLQVQAAWAAVGA